MPVTYIEELRNRAAAPNLFEHCWLSALPDSQHPPTVAELRWFRSFLERDVVYRSFAAVEQALLHEHAVAIERRIPIITSEGRAMPAAHRLYISLEIAKVLFARPRTTLDLLRSVVVYSDAGTLVENKREAGVARLRGRNHLIGRLKMIETLWKALEPITAIGGGRRGDTARLARSAKSVEKRLRYWTRRLQSGPRAADGGNLAAFLATFETEHLPVMLAAARALTATEGATGLTVLSNLELVAAGIEDLAHQIVAAGDLVGAENEGTIHISWFSQIVGRQSAHENLLIHELAHVLDFEDGGFDGCTTPAVLTSRSGAELRPRWAAAYDQAVAGNLATIDPYGLENRMEFFAVCTEHYFSRASSLRDRAPELFDLLSETYGYVPADRGRSSIFGTVKTLFLSKLRTQ